MKKIRKKITAIVMAFSMVSALAACGGNDSPKDTGTEKTTDTGNGEVTLSFQSWNPNDTTFAPAKDAWDELDTGIEIHFESLDYGDYLQNLKVKLAAGEGPDVFGLQDGALLHEFSEYLVPIGPMAEETWGTDWEEKFNPLYLELIKSDFDGYYGLPLGGTSADYFWVNTTVCDQYDIEVPTNYNELKEACQKLRDAGSYPLLSGVNNDWAALDVFMNIAGDVNQKKMYDAIAGTCDWTDPDLVEAFDIYQKLFTEGILVDGQMGGVDVGEYFNNQANAAFSLDGAWYYSTITNSEAVQAAIENGAHYKASTIDWNNDGTPAPVTTGPDVVLCVNKNSKHPEEAWKFASYMVTDGVSQMIDNNMAYLPPTVDYVLPAENFNEQAVEGFNYALKRITDGTAGYREIPYPELKSTLAEQLQLLGLESISPEDAAKEVQAASEAQER